MEFALCDMTINNSIVYKRLLQYLDRVMHYQYFDFKMMLRVFVNKNIDFTAFEAEDYRVQFTSYDHKMIETIVSPYKYIKVPFNAFYDYVKGLQS